jgi:hypothetical protein
MLRKSATFFALFASRLFVALWMIGCIQPKPSASPRDEETQPSSDAAPPVDQAAAEMEASSEEHGHKPGAHGGIIVSLGRDSYHVEAIVTGTGEVRLYTLGSDESRVQDVEIQKLVAYVKPEGAVDSNSIEVTAAPQPGDGEGKSSLFVGQLPSEVAGKSIDFTIPNITIGGERFRLGFSTKQEASHGGDAMPAKVADEAERELYLTPAGLYTQADIQANGNVTASEKFAAFHAEHDLHPKVGDKICPITLTKANPKCSWIVGGKNYEFCCPPCVDEFVAMAKTDPDRIEEPDFYVKRDAAAAHD